MGYTYFKGKLSELSQKARAIKAEERPLTKAPLNLSYTKGPAQINNPFQSKPFFFQPIQ